MRVSEILSTCFNGEKGMFVGKGKVDESAVDARCVLAGRVDTAGLVLLCLGDDDSPRVRMRVAGNPNAPLPLLEKLSEDRSSTVRLVALRNYASQTRSDGQADIQNLVPRIASGEHSGATCNVCQTLSAANCAPIKLHAHGSGFARLMEARASVRMQMPGETVPADGTVTWLASAKRTCLGWFKRLSKSA
jgi:hypothetical protein